MMIRFEFSIRSRIAFFGNSILQLQSELDYKWNKVESDKKYACGAKTFIRPSLQNLHLFQLVLLTTRGSRLGIVYWLFFQN